MSKMSEFDVITDPAGVYVPLFTPDNGGLNRRGLLQKLGLPWMVAQSAVAASVTATTAEETLATVTLPGGSLGANGSLLIEALWSANSDADDKTVRFKLGGTTFQQVLVTTSVTVFNSVTIFNRNSQSSQVANQLSGGYGASANAVVTGSIATASDQTILITGQKEQAADTLTLEAYRILALYKE